jgi:prolyl oligopeptidase
MHVRQVVLLALMIPTIAAAQGPGPLKYPDSRKADTTETLHGRAVPDPYRWLEDPNSAETKAWIEAQNRVTFGYLEQIPARAAIKDRLTKLWNYERYGSPSREGDWYIFAKNDGLQNQSVIYKTRALDAPAEVLIDPNTLSKDGTVALGSLSFSDDGTLMAYSVSASGSDWLEWRVREVATGTDRPDVLKWSKFSGASWLKDGSGFFYTRYDAPKEGEAYTGINKFPKVFFHKIGTSQDADVLVYERKDQPDWGLSAVVTEDGKYLLIYQSEGTKPENRIFVKDLSTPGAAIVPFLDKFDADYNVLGNDGARFYVLTDKDAPRRKIVGIELAKPDAASWTTIVPEGEGQRVLSGAEMVGNRLVAQWLTDAHEVVKIYGLDGTFERDVPLPAIGSVGGFTGKRAHTETFFSFSSFAYPGVIYRYDFGAGKTSVFRQPKVDFTPETFETVQVFYPSKDGTKIPMFLTYRKGLKKDGLNPTYLYGYGGFNVPMTPAFSPALVAWMEMGGIFAQASLRGGSEYGRAWYDGGRLKNKQNVFDDFIAAGEYLIREKYTSTPKLAIAGGSNGGLLVAACLTQRPDLFGAALPAVGVLDMLRFHKFTIGWAWKSDYGDPDVKDDFETLLKYSPLHNLKKGASYPPTLITTSDHDDRVAPAHSFKFAAAIQAAQAGPAPVLIRIETKAGHGAGKPTSKIIEERADIYAFLVKALGIELDKGGTRE